MVNLDIYKFSEIVPLYAKIDGDLNSLKFSFKINLLRFNKKY